MPETINILSHTLRFTPGCNSEQSTASLSCSSLIVSNLTIFLQSTKVPQLLSLLTAPMNSFVAEYLFDNYSSQNTISPRALAKDDNILNPNVFDLKSESEFKISPENGLDVGTELPGLQLSGLPLQNKLAVSMGLGLGEWKTNETLVDQAKEIGLQLSSGAVAQAKSVSLLLVSSQSGEDLFEFSLVEVATEGGAKSGYAFRMSKLKSPSKSLSFEIPKSVIDAVAVNSNGLTESSIKIAANQASSQVRSLSELTQNLKLTLRLEDQSDGSLNAQLFLLKPDSTLNEQTMQLFEESFENTELFAQPTKLTVLKPSATLQAIPAINNLTLSRLVVSETVKNLWPMMIFGKQSSQFSKCRTKCFVSSPSIDNAQDPARASCWQCSNNLVYNSRVGECETFCLFQTKNVLGNCIQCFYPNCSDAAKKLKFDFEQKNNKKIVTASDGLFRYGSDPSNTNYFQDHFDLFQIRDGMPDRQIDFTAKPLDSDRFSAEIIPKLPSSDLSTLAAKSTGYRLSLKPDRNAISSSRTLYHQRSAILNENVQEAFLHSIDPIHSNIKRQIPRSNFVPITELSSNVTDFNKDLVIDSVYKECKFNDKVMHNLALALFILVCIGNGLYVLYSLFIWNRTLVYKLPTLATVLCVHMNCLYQALIFCVFYETSFPPALSSFLRHSYRYAIHWHGAFRANALDDFQNSVSFKTQYFRTLVPKRLALDVVQNLFINFGVILLIWAVVWLITIGLYFMFKRQPITYQNNFESHFEWKHRSFVNRLTVSFAFKLACFVWIIFSVEFAFFFTYDMILPLNQHALFGVSFAFSIIFMILHFCFVLFLLYLPIYLSEFLGKVAKPSASGNNNKPNQPNQADLDNNFGIYSDQNNQESGKPPISNSKAIKTNPIRLIAQTKNPNSAKKISLDRQSIHFRHLAYITSHSYHKYHFLFALQGLRNRVYGVGNLGVTAFVFTFYGLIISAAYEFPRVAVTINFVLIFLLFVYLVLSRPGFFFVSWIVLVLAYLVFFVAKLLILLYVYEVFQRASGGVVCDPALAIIGLMFAAIGLLLIGLLLSLCYSFKLNKVYLDLFKNLDVLVSTAKEPIYLMPDDDKSIMDLANPVRVHVRRPSQLIHEMRESKWQKIEY